MTNKITGTLYEVHLIAHNGTLGIQLKAVMMPLQSTDLGQQDGNFDI